MHDLFDLFNLLSNQEKKNIIFSFRKLKIKHKIPPISAGSVQVEQKLKKMATERFGMSKNYSTIKWNNIEGIIELARRCHIDWRYSIEQGKGLLIHPDALVIVVKEYL